VQTNISQWIDRVARWSETVSPGDSQAEMTVAVIRVTRSWIQYGVFGFAVFFIVIGAVESLFGR